MPTPIQLSTLFRQHIFRGHKVLCVGPSHTLHFDPSPVMASTLTGRKGRVTLLDFDSPTMRRKLETLRSQRESEGRKLKPRAERLLQSLQRNEKLCKFGDLWGYARQFKEAYGDWLRQPVLKFGSAPDMPFTPGRLPWSAKTSPRDKFDAIIDAGTHAHILEEHSTLDRLLRNYSQLSRKTIILTDHSNPLFPTAERLKQAAEAAGAKNVQTLSVKNEYLLRTPRGVRRLRHICPYNEAVVIEW